jgi:phenylalanyl-tRNA synthetase beta chain
MKIPLSLIKEFIDLHLSPQEIADLLTLAGIEVDKIEHQEPSFSQVVVGKIISVDKHPNADKLVLVQVDDGSEILPIVCGASNCRKGMKVALAKIGSSLFDENGKKWTIKKSTLRSVDSFGMLCSAKELQLSSNLEGILELPEEFALGQQLSSLIWDPVFEISLTPNLGHCASGLGIARELSAITGKSLYPKATHSLEENGSSIRENISVSLDAKKECLRYCCRMMEGLQESSSPFWLKQTLENSGYRSIHPVVDVMNYLMIAYGHPLHAFDFDKISGKKIHIHSNLEIQIVQGLDEKEYTLPQQSLLISDTQKPIAIAGILGLENSSVHASTRNILIEAAFFDPISIRKSCKALNIKTESSFRFERGTDIDCLPLVLDKAVSLIHLICKGTIAKGMIDLYPEKICTHPIRFRSKRANQLLGTELSSGEMENIFHRLQMSTKIDRDLLVVPPSYRNDIKTEIDLIEEIARIYGYNNIGKKAPFFASSKIPDSPIYLLEKEIKKHLCAAGLQEFITSDLISPKLASLCQEMHFAKEGLIEVLHSKSADFSILRPSFLPSLLQVVQFNLDHQRESLLGFEVGKVHFKNKDRFIEEPVVSLILCGKRASCFWKEKPKEMDFYTLKGLLENLFSALGFSPTLFEPSNFPFLHPQRQAKILFGKAEMGVIGEVHPSSLAKLGIEEKVYFAEVNLRSLLEAKKTEVRFHEMPSFPASQRDWTLSLPQEFSYSTIVEQMKKISSPLLERFYLLDLYEDPISSQKKFTLRFIYRDKEKTITMEEVEKEHEKLMKDFSSLLFENS